MQRTPKRGLLADFHIDNLAYLDRHSAPDDPTIYTGSIYSIDLRGIRGAVRDLPSRAPPRPSAAPP